MIQRVSIQTHAQSEFVDITAQLQAIAAQSDLASGTLLLYCPHTSCGITIQENCDPGVQHDMLHVLNRIVPRNDPAYQHIEDNSASHLQTSMMGVSHFVFIEDGNLVLGRWQAIYLAEFDGPRTRTLLVKVQPDG